MEVNPLLKRYIPLVDYIGQVFGENCEVILHDLTNLEHSIVAIANNHITGREVGGHITDFGLEVVHDPRYQDKNFVVSYAGTTPDGKRSLKSSTFFIRDDAGVTVGLFCINFDITDWLSAQRLIEGLTFLRDDPDTPTKAPAPQVASVETFSSSVDDTMFHAIDRVLSGFDVAPNRLTTDEKRQAVDSMQARGIFALKGAVSLVAKKLDVSEQTVYRYLRESQNSDRG